MDETELELNEYSREMAMKLEEMTDISIWR
jgi:hypothetical protein